MHLPRTCHLGKPCTFIPRLLPRYSWNSFLGTGLIYGPSKKISVVISPSQGQFKCSDFSPDLTRLPKLETNSPKMTVCQHWGYSNLQLWLCQRKSQLQSPGRMNWLLTLLYSFQWEQSHLPPTAPEMLPLILVVEGVGVSLKPSTHLDIQILV